MTSIDSTLPMLVIKCKGTIEVLPLELDEPLEELEALLSSLRPSSNTTT